MLIAIKSTLICKVLNVSVKNVEHVFVQLNLGPNILIIGCVYIPPVSPLILYEQFFNAVNELFISYPKAKFVLLGDFNLPSLNFSPYTLPIICNSPIESYFISMLSLFHFNQFNLVRNHNNVTLDLVLSNIHLFVLNDPDPLLPIDKHHPALNISLKYEQFNTLSTLNNIIYDFKNCDYIRIVKYIGDSLNIINSISSDINIVVDDLYKILHDAINIFVPKKRLYINTYPIWYSNSLKSLLREKKISHLIYKKFKNISDYISFSSLRAKCKRLAKSDYKNYINKVQSSIRNNPKYFWSFIKNSNNDNALPQSLYLDTAVVNNGTDIVNLFAKYFSDAYSIVNYPLNSSSLNTDNINLNSNSNINSISFTEIDVLNLISNLKLSNNPGPDGIPSIFLYNCRFILTPVLTNIFKLSLSRGIFPSIWKTSFISPIFKNGDSSLISNYRPISKLSVIPKLFSHLISSKLSNFCSSLLSTHQYGFTPKRSPCNNLAVVKNIILHSFEMNAQTDIIYTDFAKAFDQVNHVILIKKLQIFGFSGALLNWFQSFLSGRHQIVKYLNFTSIQFSVPSGVPQGDHLSTLLFNIFINDLPSVITNSNIFLFADDAKLVKIIKSEQDAINLQLDINNLLLWCNENHLFLNFHKCKFMKFYLIKNPIKFLYTISASNIELVNQFKDLGVIFDPKLNFSLHTEMIKNKAFRNLGFIKRACGSFSDPDALKILYCSLVRSNLEYCHLIWINNTLKQNLMLESVQNNFLRFISFKFNITRPIHGSYINVLNFLNISLLSDRRSLLLSKYLQKLILGSIDCPEILSLIRFKINSLNTRDPKPFYPLFSTKNYILNSPANLLMTAGNTYIFDYI